ncbi:MAG: electron transport complex subunit RsxC [Thermoanaerobaculaceae bacterium]|nr:electron transport complex subunit RsxC [Thermoanaerobaculaceae bacterium]MDI9621827.1 electron transport complex subunit RsxC [Acidobacteriota bacterium]NLH34375.1 electron transport complex subunit RsxC [Lentimicrobium sp.]HPW54458.1 electron transport complex subunit RsxC [Thermoanaerobaculaceae bacterium]
MSAQAFGARGTGSFPRGIHPAQAKHHSAAAALEVLPPPARVEIPLLQHLGAPATAAVKPRDPVAWGTVLGVASGFVSASVHSPLGGKVVRLGVTTLPNGRHVPTVAVAAEGEQVAGQALWEALYGGPWPTAGLDELTPEAIGAVVREAGLVGQGGAAFPTHVKLTPNPAKPVDTVLVNGCECEPFLTADDRLMREAPAPIVAGALLAARAAGARQVVIGVEDNKPEAVAALRAAAEGTGVVVQSVRTKYPQGGERQLVLSVVGRIVPTGGLPLDVGVVVVNVGTAAAIAAAVLRGRPLTHRVVAVTGPGVVRPANLLVPIGVSYREVLDFCGGLRPEAVRVLSGGPMMGLAVGDLATPVTKGTSGITVLTAREVRKAAETACVRCGRCGEACPLGLVPTRLALASRHRDWALARRYHIQACIECGCCAYVCPAAIPLTQLIRMGKAMLPKE